MMMAERAESIWLSLAVRRRQPGLFRRRTRCARLARVDESREFISEVWFRTFIWPAIAILFVLITRLIPAERDEDGNWKPVSWELFEGTSTLIYGGALLANFSFLLFPPSFNEDRVTSLFFVALVPLSACAVALLIIVRNLAHRRNIQGASSMLVSVIAQASVWAIWSL